MTLLTVWSMYHRIFIGMWWSVQADNIPQIMRPNAIWLEPPSLSTRPEAMASVPHSVLRRCASMLCANILDTPRLELLGRSSARGRGLPEPTAYSAADSNSYHHSVSQDIPNTLCNLSVSKVLIVPWILCAICFHVTHLDMQPHICVSMWYASCLLAIIRCQSESGSLRTSMLNDIRCYNGISISCH